MTETKAPPAEVAVAVIGGGLAGLNAARLLQAAGHDAHLFEARDRWGGRILTQDARGQVLGAQPGEAAGPQGFDLGPSWVWPAMQPDIGRLVTELDLPVFGQQTQGDVIFERMSREGPRRYPTPAQTPQSLRLVGGSAALVRAELAALDPARLHLNSPLRALTRSDAGVRLDFATGPTQAGQVILAVPPRLLAQDVTLDPAVPPQVAQLWRDTPTWMAPQAKFFALYDRPFWRSAGLSGTAQSMVGPLSEIHDACTQDGQAALFGFVGMAAPERARLGEAALAAACIDQLARLFGPEAAVPVQHVLQDWASDPLTATPEDIRAPGHPQPAKGWVQGPWAEVLHLAGSETSASEPGYLAGAVTASEAAVADCLARLVA